MQSQSDQNSQNNALQSIDMSALFSTLARRKKTIIGSILLAVFIALIYLYQAVPQFRAETTILIDARQQNVLDGGAVLAGITGDSAIIESQVEIIRSRTLLKRVADQFNLYDDGELLPQKGFFAKLKDAFNGLEETKKDEDATVADVPAVTEVKAEEEEESIFIDSSDVNEEEVSQSIFDGIFSSEEEEIDPKILKAFVITQIEDRLTVQRKGLTQVLTIGYRSRNAEKARKISDAIAKAYLNDQLEAKLEATQRATQWLDDRLSGIRSELQQKEQSIVNFKQKHNLFSAQGATQIEQQVSRLNEQLIMAKSNTAEKRAAYNQVLRLSRSNAIQSFSSVLSSNVITNLRDREAEIAREVADLSARYGGSHPKLRNAEAQLGDIKSQIRSEVKRILAGAKSEYDIARSRENSLASSLSSLRTRFNSTGRHAARLGQLEREADTARTAFEAISERFKQTDNSEDMQQSDARIISAAETPLVPVAPKKKVIILFAVLAGGILGVGLAFLQENVVSGFMNSDMVEKTLQLPVISNLQEMTKKELAKENNAKHIHQYIREKPLSSMAEGIRKIRVHAEAQHDNNRGAQIVLVTSSVPNEGKTEVASAYASSAANAGMRVLLIDCDFRNPSVGDLHDRKTKNGLGEYLLSNASLEDILQKDMGENIDYIGINALPKSPSDLFKAGKFEALLEGLRKDYSLIILDTPPLAPVIDTAVVANYVDNIVYITAWEKTPRNIVENSLKSLKDNREKVSGIVLNRIDAKRESGYGYYHGYALKNYAKYYSA